MERVKPVGYIKLSRGAKSHIPEIIRHETNTAAGEKIPYVLNARSVLLYDPRMSKKELSASLDVIKRDIALRGISTDPSTGSGGGGSP